MRKTPPPKPQEKTTIHCNTFDRPRPRRPHQRKTVDGGQKRTIHRHAPHQRPLHDHTPTRRDGPPPGRLPPYHRKTPTICAGRNSAPPPPRRAHTLITHLKGTAPPHWTILIGGTEVTVPDRNLHNVTRQLPPHLPYVQTLPWQAPNWPDGHPTLSPGN